MDSLSSVSIVTLGQKNTLGDLETISNRTEAQNVAGPRIRFLIRVGDTHSTSCCDVEADEASFVICDGDESNIIRENVDVVVRGYSNRNFELRNISAWVWLEEPPYLSRKIIWPVHGLYILDSVTSNHLFVQPDLVICAGFRK
jgi:hypothetical protein